MTRRDLLDHELYIHRTCPTCLITFSRVTQLRHHLDSVHNPTYLCNMCGTQCNGEWALKKHKRDVHANYVCTQCNPQTARFMTEVDLQRHKTVYHKPENTCHFCELSFSCEYKVRRHIIDKHYEFPCFYCGDGFPTQYLLYEHQTKHCYKSFKCKHCNDRFDDLVTCQRHELTTHGRYGISLEACPTVSVVHRFINHMKYAVEPWVDDVDNVISKQGYYMDKVARVVHSTKETLRGRGQVDISDPNMHPHIVRHAIRSVRTTTIESIQKAYLDHAAEIVTHSRRDDNRQLMSYNIHMIENIPFDQQIDSILNDVYMENECNIPYKISLMFAFMLFTPSTGKVGYWHANTHLSHEARAGDVLQQRDNIWEIRSRVDMQACANDIKNTDFFTMMRNALEDSNSVILRVTNNRSEEIERETAVLYDRYIDAFHLGDVDKSLFNGVHINLIPSMEHLYGYRINVYTIGVKDGKVKFDICAASRSQFVYNTKRSMSLLLYANHYYLILDKARVLESRYCCFKCGITFNKSYNLQRHCNNGCRASITQEQYASGAVESSQLLLERIKTSFDVPDNIIPPLLYTEDGMLTRDESNNIYFTDKFATYDFESKLQQTTLHEIRARRLNYIRETYADDPAIIENYELASNIEEEALQTHYEVEIVYDDDGVQMTGEEFRNKYGDEDFIMENVPVSYVIAYNFAANIEDVYDFIEEGMSSDRCTVEGEHVAITRSNANHKQLVASFYRDLKDVASTYRRRNLEEYSLLLEYLHGWFEERHLTLNIGLPSEDLWHNDEFFENTDEDRNGCEVVYASNSSTSIGDGTRFGRPTGDNTTSIIDIEELSADGSTRIKGLTDEIRLMGDLKRFLEMLVVVGYNSGKYDIPLIKSELYHELFIVDEHPTDSQHFHVIKKGSSYISVQVTNLSERGCFGFILKDMREFTGPGGNLRSFMKAFKDDNVEQHDNDEGDDKKFYWPYEWMKEYDVLKEKCVPPYKAFYSSLRDENVLEEDMNDYIRKHNLFHLTEEELMARPDRPRSGLENYEMIKRKWSQKGWSSMLDYLLYYNEMDVRPFLKSILIYLKALFQHKVNPLFSCYSLPGVAKKILSSYMPPGTIYHVDNQEIFKLLKKAEVGGQSIVMTRENPPTHPYVVGYDACSLYLSSFAKNHFIGRPQLYKDKGGGLLHKVDLSRSERSAKGIQRRRKASSKIANEYFDCIQEVDYTEDVIVREWRLPLSHKERQYIQQRYNECHIPILAPMSFVVDGLIKRNKTIIEFDGCLYHACNTNERCNSQSLRNSYCRYVRVTVDDDGNPLRRENQFMRKITLTPDNIRKIDEIRDEVLSTRNYTVQRIKECVWVRERRDNALYKQCIDELQSFEKKMIYWSDNTSVVPFNFILQQILAEEVDGLVFVDIYTPESLKSKFEQFAPIIKHATVQLKDVGPYMQRVAAELDVKMGTDGRRMVIDSYFGNNIGLTCDSLRQLISMGLKITKIYAYIRYKSFPLFKPFVDKITRLRMEGDTDPSKAIIATMAKLLGNSAFGSCITNVEKHREMSIIVNSGRGRGTSQLQRDIASRRRFRGYEVVNCNVLEVCSQKRRLCYTQLRQISNVIFDGSKNTMRVFINFCFTVLEAGSYQFMSTDTDSIYIAFKNGPTFEDNVDTGMRSFYEREKHKYFVTPSAQYGERTPGLFKIEASGTNMVALCAKSYVVYKENENTIELDKIKFSCKGVQKGEICDMSTQDEADMDRETLKKISAFTKALEGSGSDDKCDVLMKAQLVQSALLEKLSKKLSLLVKCQLREALNKVNDMSKQRGADVDDVEEAVLIHGLLQRMDEDDASFEDMYKRAWMHEDEKDEVAEAEEDVKHALFSFEKKKKTSEDRKGRRRQKNVSFLKKPTTGLLKSGDFKYHLPPSVKCAAKVTRVTEDQWMDSLCGQGGWYQTHMIDVIVNDARAAYQLAPIILRRGRHHEVLTCHWLWNRAFLGKTIWLLVTTDTDKYFDKSANPATEYLNDLIGNREPEKSTLWADVCTVKNVEMSVRASEEARRAASLFFRLATTPGSRSGFMKFGDSELEAKALQNFLDLADNDDVDGKEVKLSTKADEVPDDKTYWLKIIHVR
eukprot:Seg3562.6 transcript_id=Seg3562.6/GoldUCD/mRNA.D3Y31 product="Gastrula zinc finger protein XlCGF52.1" protein_id=Seg3562.6/GoldUCD/D3Y31